MDSPPPIPDAAPQEAEAKRDEREKEMVHKTKVIQFLGRTTPIILQNDNGPCPLLAICNVLSLKNSLNLSPDVPEVSQEKLLSLVAERLIDSNSNTDNKDAGYVENQQQNIADAIDLLPRLTTGIDVNIKFRRIDDFEFTRECAIFDLLDIPLYHGWIVDPQDRETADAIGSKSYNTLVGELVSLETRTMESEQEKNPEDDNVDFVAATTAALGVPSPCLSRGHSFTDSPSSGRKGDIEEEAELLRALKLSAEESHVPDGVVSGVDLVGSADMKKSEPRSVPDSLVGIDLVENADMKKSEPVTLSETVEKNGPNETVNSSKLIPDDSNILSNQNVDVKPIVVSTQEAVTLFPETDSESTECCNSAVGSTGTNVPTERNNFQPLSIGADLPSVSNSSQDKSRSDEHVQTEVTSTSDLRNNPNDNKDRNSSSLLTPAADIESSSDQVNNIGKPESAFTSGVDGSEEPIYEGEECIKESENALYENREPVYEGEVLLAEQVDKADDGDSKDRLSVRQGEVIKNFLKSSASQLTVYGLFLLLENVKERELCVFFRNNHFNTMFKHEGSLYILATDQGFINQPDLVWEKLNEVNGDTVYMTGNFKEFKMDDTSNGSWDEQNAMANTADYLATMDNAAQSHSSFNSDLQLAIALQQQEFDQQQQQQHPQRNLEQPATTGGSRLVTGPQVSQNSGKYKSSSSSSKPESKSKEKCIVM